MIDPRRIENLKAWMKTQRQNYKNMILGDDDASQWCADEVERIERHIQTIELLEAKLVKAMEALEFYADGEWPQDYPGGVLYASGDDTPEFKTHLDYGDKARTTLAELKGEKG